jgi:peptide-methionine (R)-S-oxide reductase
MTTPADYKTKLTDEQYDVLFNKATEVPFSGEYDQMFAEGEYACAACGTVLFDSDKKFDAECGWPSFYDAKPGAVIFHEDTTLGMKRVAVILGMSLRAKDLVSRPTNGTVLIHSA